MHWKCSPVVIFFQKNLGTEMLDAGENVSPSIGSENSLFNPMNSIIGKSTTTVAQKIIYILSTLFLQ